MARSVAAETKPPSARSTTARAGRVAVGTAAAAATLCPQGLVVGDQAVGGAVVARDRGVALELGQDLAGELLAQLHAPLVEAVDVPDDALDEDLVLVEGDQRAQPVGGELAVEDRVGGPVAGERLVGHELLER